MAYLDQKEIANFLAQELFYQQFITLEGLNSGVPTRTTPTLTPTTLRNIEQTFIELQSKPETHENEAGFVPPLVHSIGNNQYISASEADNYSTSTIGTTLTTKSNNMWHNSLSQSSSDSNNTHSITPPLTQKTSLINNTPNHHHPQQTRRNMGGRKPTKDVNISPEEEERRRIRRERNKAAAARCRKRRVDHTNALIQETDELEQKRQLIKDELQQLQAMKDELEYLLESHRNSSNCRLESQSPPDIKPFIINSDNNQINTTTKTTTTATTTTNGVILDSEHNNHHKHRTIIDERRVKTELIEIQHNDEHFSLPSPAKRIMLSSTVPISKPNRPNSLNVGVTTSQINNNNNNNNNNNASTNNNNNNNKILNNVADIAGISITTPSSGIQFNFDSLMVGGTGLTPVSAPLIPSCSTQQRNIPVSTSDITSPDTCGPPKLVSL